MIFRLTHIIIIIIIIITSFFIYYYNFFISRFSSFFITMAFTFFHQLIGFLKVNISSFFCNLFSFRSYYTYFWYLLIILLTYNYISKIYYKFTKELYLHTSFNFHFLIIIRRFIR